MGSRRATTHSSFGNGRSSNGNDVNGSSRSSNCSYLSNVRPENRSTLCSVIAQLTEETQPCFVTTLKSKAVSENCTVKFSCVVTGHPAPQVTWYKDDKQLDRFCGLPKYEIFRNGQNHSLHIYNCTVEDAAIYQTSAINLKGIVSCSGVLEVGEMNEFKIHQRYFAKLKQMAENKCRETKDKENQDYLQTTGPDRTQRKRHSTTEAFLSTPSPTEEEGSRQVEAIVAESGSQEAKVEKPEKKPAPVTDGVASAKTSGQTSNDNASKSRTYTYDPTQNIFTTHQPKTPFVNKKIKISNSVKVSKADVVKSVSSESTTKNETSSLVALEAVKTDRKSEVMEMENDVNPPIVQLDLKSVKTNRKTLATEKSAFGKSSLKDKNCTASESRDPTPPSFTLSENKGKKQQNHGKEGGHKDIEKHLEMKNQSPLITFTQKQRKSTNLNLKKDIHATKHVTTMDNDRKSKASSDERFTLSFTESKEKPRDIRTVVSQSLAASLVSEKETSPGQKNESISLPAVPSKVTQAHTEMNGNDAPVNFELPPDQCTTSSHQLQKTDDIETSPSFGGLQAMLNGSRESNESCPEMFTSQKMTPLEIPGGAENIPGCNVSPAIQQSQVDTAIKTVEGTEIQYVEKVAVSEINALSPSEKMLEMETESAAQCMTEQPETGKTDDSGNTNSGVAVPSCLKMKMNELKSTVEEKTSSELQKLKSDEFETSLPRQNQTPQNTKPLEPDIDPLKPSTPEQKVISIAELLRSQIKALDLTQTNSVSNSSTNTNLTPSPTTKNPGKSQEVGIDSVTFKSEEITLKPDNKTETSIKDAPLSNLKATLMDIYQQLNKTEEEQTLTLDVKSATAQALNEPLISFRDTEIDGRARKHKEAVVEINQKTEPRNEVPSKDRSVASDPGSKNEKDILLLTSKDEFASKSISKQAETVIPESPETVTNIKASNQEINATILEHYKNGADQRNGVGLSHQQTPERNLNNKMEKRPSFSDQDKTEEQNIDTDFSERIQIIQSQSEFSSNKQENGFPFIHQGTSEVKENLRSDFIIDPTPESSPLLRKRNCISPIPSATAQELASGARRKISTPKSKPEEAEESPDKQTQKTELPVKSSRLSTTPASPKHTQRSPLLQPARVQNSVVERQPPLVSRRKVASETQTLNQMVAEEIHSEGKPAEKDKHNPFKAPQVIRKIRAETFADASGHLKMWCQFFNILSDSTIKWYKNEEEIALVKRNAGDETQVNLAIAQASSIDSGVYGCSITNEYGTDSTDFLLSAEILAGMSLREDLGVGEEIEMTPLIFTKGLADSGTWGNKFFGRIVMAESHIGDGCSHKAWRAKVIYGLEPVFESGNMCVIKVRSCITYGGKEESRLIERNLDIMKKECKIQNLAREYCKIFSAEARVIENFGPSFDVIPVYLMYRPANTIPYATVETDLKGVYKKYSDLDHTGRIDIRTGSEVEQKCSTLQHWIFQWTSGNLLLTRLEGVDTKLTNVGISVKSTGYQGLSVEGNPKVFEHFVSQHKCTYFCGLLGLKPLKVMDSLTTPVKPKGSRSPLLQRKKASSSSSPQLNRKTAVSPRLPRKTDEDISVKEKAADASKDE